MIYECKHDQYILGLPSKPASNQYVIMKIKVYLANQFDSQHTDHWYLYVPFGQAISIASMRVPTFLHPIWSCPVVDGSMVYHLGYRGNITQTICKASFTLWRKVI